MARKDASRAALRDLAGVLVAGAAILIYGLSCRPAWDPDGKRVAFPYRDGERSGIALYEGGQQPARRLVEEPGDALAGAQCAWSSNGRWLYVLRTLNKESLRVLRVDPGNGKAETVVDIGGLDDAHTIYPAALADDRWLWVSACDMKTEPQNVAFRVDLAERRVEPFFADDERAVYVIDGGPRGLFYVRGADEGPTEFGRLDGGGPRLVPLFKVPQGEGGDAAPFPLIEARGTRLAWFDKRADGRRLRLLDESGKTLEEVPLPADTEDETWATWTAGGIVAATERRREGGPKEIGLLRVALGSRQALFVPIGSGAKDEADTPVLQPAASPDGRQVAVAVSGIDPPGTLAALMIFDALDLAARPLRVALAPPSGNR